MLGLSGGELIVVMAVILVLFGAKKIPDFAKGLGQGIKEFKKASREVQDELERAASEANSPPPPAPAPKPSTVAQASAVAPAAAPEATAAEAAAVEPHAPSSPAAKG
jgi:sec-independent protein translocase protein TatA